MDVANGLPTNSIGMFDVAKGLLMLFIMATHSISSLFPFWDYGITGHIGGLLINGVGAIFLYGAMPVFYMICGYGIRKRPFRRAVASQIRIFARPYITVVISVTILLIIKRWLIGFGMIEALRHTVLPYLLVLCPGGNSCSESTWVPLVRSGSFGYICSRLFCSVCYCSRRAR